MNWNRKNMAEHQKQALRKKFLALLKNQKEGLRNQKSKLIAGKFCSLMEFHSAHCVMIYSALQEEVDTAGIRAQAHTLGKKVAFPMMIDKSKDMIPVMVSAKERLEPGPYGIRQPVNPCHQICDLQEIDLVAVPGVAFDHKGNRLGRGQGCYDRFLKKLPPATSTVGLAFDFQVVEDLPVVSDYDVPVSFVLANELF